jgi:DNA-binding CsgD family transcriptional regulator
MAKLSLSQKEFIDISRKSGKSCQEIANDLGIKVRLVYKWGPILKKTVFNPFDRVVQ